MIGGVTGGDGTRNGWPVTEGGRSQQQRAHFRITKNPTNEEDQVQREQLNCYLLYNEIIFASSESRVLVLNTPRRGVIPSLR
jgi:hypothetical protein